MPQRRQSGMIKQNIRDKQRIDHQLEPRDRESQADRGGVRTDRQTDLSFQPWALLVEGWVP